VINEIGLGGASGSGLEYVLRPLQNLVQQLLGDDGTHDQTFLFNVSLNQNQLELPDQHKMSSTSSLQMHAIVCKTFPMKSFVQLQMKFLLSKLFE